MADSSQSPVVHNTHEILEAKAHIWNHTFNFINSMSLKCAVELGIPDAIHAHGKPITLPDLAAAISVPPTRIPCLKRLLHLLVHSDFLAREAKPDSEEDVFTLTTMSCLLVEEKSSSIAPFVVLILDNVLLTPWLSLSSWFKRDAPTTAFELTHGLHAWDAVIQWPEFNHLLNEGTASDARLVTKLIIKECSNVFRGLTSLVEVSWGTGTMARDIVEAFPQIKSTVLELPHVAALAKESEGVKSVTEDMFQHIPPADAVLLNWVLHVCNDERCGRILKLCKGAIPKVGGKVIIVDMVMNTDGVHHALAETQYLWDLYMMVHCTGKQRSQGEWNKIITYAGFTDYKIIPSLGLRSIIEAFP